MQEEDEDEVGWKKGGRRTWMWSRNITFKI